MLKEIINTEKSNLPLDYTLQGDLIYYRTKREEVSTIFTYNYKTFVRTELFSLEDKSCEILIREKLLNFKDKIYFLRKRGEKLLIFTSLGKLYIYENDKLSIINKEHDDFTFSPSFEGNNRFVPCKNRKFIKSGLFDLEDMKVLWEKNNQVSAKIKNDKYFGFDNSKKFNRLNIENGEIVWEVGVDDLSLVYGKEIKDWFFLIVAMTNDSIILAPKFEGRSLLCAIDKVGGKINWVSNTVSANHENSVGFFPIEPRRFTISPDKKELIAVYRGIYSVIDVETGKNKETSWIVPVRKLADENAHGGTGLTKCWKNKIIFHGGRGICVFDRDKKEIVETQLLPEGHTTNSVSTANIHNGHYFLNSSQGNVFVFKLTDD